MKIGYPSLLSYRLVSLVLCLAVLLMGVSPASAADRCYVMAGAGGLDDGTSWGNAYENPQAALADAACLEIWVAAGTYVPGSLRTDSFRLKNGVSLYGGFAGTETLLSERNPAANVTVLSGEIGDPGVMTDNSYHVVVGSGTNNTALLDGFTVTGGNANGTHPSYVGGGIFNFFGSPSLANLTVSGNTASNFGGGIYNYTSSPHLTGVIITNNSSAYLGGGMYNSSSYPSLENVTLHGNSAQFGGGIYNISTSNADLANVTFSGNIAAVAGGAMYNKFSSNPVITNSILYGDTGGEIFNEAGSTPTVSYSIVQGSYAGTGNLDADPLLGPLAENGGFTKTMTLGLGSPAIDSGTNAGCPVNDQRGIARPQDGDGNGTAVCDIGATESRSLTKTFLSAGAQDGWVLELDETGNTGGTINAGAETLLLGDDAQDRQYRSILSFNTAGLPDDAPILAVTLKIMKSGQVGTDPFTTHGNILADVRKGAFSGNAVLQITDFQAAASKASALTIRNTPVGNWYSGTMGAANYTYINKAGVTQFRLRFTKDDNDDLAVDALKFYSGDYVTTTSRPKLIVRYYVP